MRVKEPRKPKRPRNAVAEQVVELKTDYPTAAKRLRQMQGNCRQQDGEGRTLFFHCDKKGKFMVIPPNGRYAIWAIMVEGRLYVEDGRTKAVLYTRQIEKKNRTPVEIVIRSIGYVAILLMWLVIFVAVPAAYWQWTNLAAVVLLAATAIARIVRGRCIVQNQDEDAAIMIEGALTRLQAVDDWEK